MAQSYQPARFAGYDHDTIRVHHGVRATGFNGHGGGAESLSETQSLAGTLPYMAPEQLLDGTIDARTDIHAAGSVLYEMATGQRPFADVEGSQLIGAILRRPPRPPTALNPRLSPELERIIGKCLEKEPEMRPGRVKCGVPVPLVKKAITRGLL